ncbi:hypothetical protein EV649_2617 [Kribbella sp. VKM Ac-2569]|nr:hypothetical protein EV649_2617 [Kribbella sp. VKM Ac-2569]
MRSFGVFLGWMVVTVIGYGVWYLAAPDVPPWGCRGICATERDRVVFLGWFVLAPCLLVQALLGLLVNARYSEEYWGEFATGTAAFFTTVPLPVFMLLVAFR